MAGLKTFSYPDNLSINSMIAHVDKDTVCEDCKHPIFKHKVTKSHNHQKFYTQCATAECQCYFEAEIMIKKGIKIKSVDDNQMHLISTYDRPTRYYGKNQGKIISKDSAV